MRIRGEKLARFVLPACVACVVVAAAWSLMGPDDSEEATKQRVQLEQKLVMRERVRLAKHAIEARTGPSVVSKVVTNRVEDVPAASPDLASLGWMRASRDAALGEASRLSNSLARVVQDSEAYRRQSARSLEEAKAEILARSRRIEELQAQLGGLNQQLLDLGEKLSRQAARVAEAERQLATMEGDRTEARRNLDALLAEKAELERRFRSKEALTAQLKKIRDEEYASRESFLKLNWLAFSKPKKAGVPKPAPGAKAGPKPDAKPASKPAVRLANKADPKKAVAPQAMPARGSESPRSKAMRPAQAASPESRARGSISAVPAPR